MKKLTLLFTCFLLSIGLVIAQDRQVSGTITDDSGEPVIGASVIVKGNASIGTITDLNGQFSFSVPSSATTLIVKYLGMTDQEVAVASNITVTLHQSESVLDEVIVVAYGTVKRSQFTGSASVVKAEEIGKVQTSNVVNALVGKVTGMQIAQSSGQPGVTSPTVRVRGINSINAGNSPLVIVDGAPYSGDLNDLNALDIESVTVLKDATSKALYGSRAANGVMMITTKKGASGTTAITVDAKWGANTRSVQDYNYIKSPAQYYEIYYGALKNYFVNTMSYSTDEAHALTNRYMTMNQDDYGLGYNVYNIPTGQSLIGSNGKLNPNATLGNVVNYRGAEYMFTPDNWMDAAYKQTIRQEYNFSASASSDKSTFYTSLGYLDNQGITANSNFKRVTGRLKADYQMKPWLKVGTNMLYANRSFNLLDNDGSTGSSGNLFAIATKVAPIYPLYIRDGQGNIRIDNNGLQMYDYGDGGNAGLYRPSLGQSNAVQAVLLDTYGGEGNMVHASNFADITFLKDFKFSVINTVMVSETRWTQVTNPYYGQYASSNGIVYKSHNRSFSYNFQQSLTYAKDIDVHHINLFVAHDYNRDQYFSLSATKTNMFDPSNYELAGAVKDGSPNSYTTDINRDNFVSRLMYDYENKYYASVNYSIGASSRFHPDNRWGRFWGAGAAWDISKEEFMKSISLINMLKLKVSYGEEGNDDIGNYRYTDIYSIVNSNGRPAAVPSAKGNKDITWENMATFNIGFDFSMFKERLNGTIEYYNKATKDMLFSFPLPPSMGWTSYYDNIGDMSNKGIEAELNFIPIKTNDLTWSLRLNLTSNKNKITRLPEERKTVTTPEGVKGYSSGNQFFGEGITLYNFYMFKYAGVNEKGEATYWRTERDEEGNFTGEMSTVTNTSDATQYLCGTSLPDVTGGFGTALQYKGFDFSIDFAYQIGGEIYDTDYAGSMGPARASGNRGYAFHADVLNSWTPENTGSNIPRFQFNDLYTNATSDRFLIDASYLTLQNISLGYTLPTRICKYIGMEKLRVYAVCDNAWLWSKRQGMDPRQSIDGYTTSSYYAPIRSFSGGITFTF